MHHKRLRDTVVDTTFSKPRVAYRNQVSILFTKSSRAMVNFSSTTSHIDMRSSNPFSSTV